MILIRQPLDTPEERPRGDVQGSSCPSCRIITSSVRSTCAIHFLFVGNLKEKGVAARWMLWFVSSLEVPSAPSDLSSFIPGGTTKEKVNDVFADPRGRISSQTHFYLCDPDDSRNNRRVGFVGNQLLFSVSWTFAFLRPVDFCSSISLASTLMGGCCVSLLSLFSVCCCKHTSCLVGQSSYKCQERL